jgi:2',3'-cyclic-nucleotide 2'-phosphodiesterase/3'-nucleotidase
MLVAPNSSRIRNLRHEGAPVRDEQVFLVATNNYRAGGGGTFFGDTIPEVVAASADLVRDTVMRYVKRRKCIAPHPQKSWRLAPLPAQANVILHTGRGARGLEPGRLLLDYLGQTGSGFEKYRLRGYAT